MIRIKHDLSATEIIVFRHQLEIVRDFEAVSAGMIVKWVDLNTSFLQVPDAVTGGENLQIANGQVVSVVEDPSTGSRTSLGNQVVKIKIPNSTATVVEVYRRQIEIVQEFDATANNYATTRNLPDQFAEFNNRKGIVEEKFGEQNFEVFSEMRIFAKFNQAGNFGFCRVRRFFL